jgi:hypothetical protein
MKNVNRLPVVAAIGILLMGITAPVHALGLGRPVSRAILGESFQATVPLRLEAGEEFDDKCLVADVYFGDDKIEAARVQTTLVPGKGAERSVRITTSAVINEPVVTLYVAAGCAAKVSRKFVAFADPPALAAVAQDVSPPVDPVRDAEGPGVASSGAAGVSQSATSGRPPASRRADRLAAAERSRTVASASPSGSAGERQASPAHLTESGAEHKAGRLASARKDKLSARLDKGAAPATGARLVLDPVEADATVAPSLMMSSDMKGGLDVDSAQAQERRAAAAALWAAMNASPEQLARDRTRMQELEQRLARLQQDSVAAREKVLALEARVREAEEGRLTQPLVMGLAGVSALLAAALFFVVRRQKPADAQATWWQPDAEAEAVSASGEPAPVSAPLAEPVLDRTAAEFVALDAAARATEPPALAGQASPAAEASVPLSMPATQLAATSAMATGPQAPVAISAVNPEASEAVRALSVEELIDLEQQAEFFSVLGQDDAAIELLESSIHHSAGSSPLPYLKLLEMYQRLGRETDYQRMQAEFNQRFNAYAPSWDADLSHGHDLTDYPGVLERLQAIWSSPPQAMSVLQKSLTRPDDSVETFDLPAYRELLFLYAVARDLSERESQDRPAVDLLARDTQALTMVPDIDLDEPTSVAPLMATRPVKATAEATPSLSLDLSLDDLSTDHIDLPQVDVSAPGLSLAPAEATDQPSRR